MVTDSSLSETRAGLAGEDVALSAVAPELARQARRGGRAMGALFFALFGAVWLLVGLSLAHWRGLTPIILLAVLTAVLSGAAARVLANSRGAMAAQGDLPERRRMRRWFGSINLAQWGAIIAAVYVLQRLDLAAWIAPAVMLIVGLHMLPLARLFRYRAHYLTGGALIATALVYPFAAPGGPSSPSGCLIAGAVLWLSAAWALRQARG